MGAFFFWCCCGVLILVAVAMLLTLFFIFVPTIPAESAPANATDGGGQKPPFHHHGGGHPHHGGGNGTCAFCCEHWIAYDEWECGENDVCYGLNSYACCDVDQNGLCNPELDDAYYKRCIALPPKLVALQASLTFAPPQP